MSVGIIEIVWRWLEQSNILNWIIIILFKKKKLPQMNQILNIEFPQIFAQKHRYRKIRI